MLAHILTQSVIVFLQCTEVIFFIGVVFGTENNGDNLTVIVLLSLTGFAGMLFGGYNLFLCTPNCILFIHFFLQECWFQYFVNHTQWPTSCQRVHSIQWLYCVVYFGPLKECHNFYETLPYYCRLPFQQFQYVSSIICQPKAYFNFFLSINFNFPRFGISYQKACQSRIQMSTVAS